MDQFHRTHVASSGSIEELSRRITDYRRRHDDTNRGSQRGSRQAISILFIRLRKRFSSGWSVADRKQSAAARWKNANEARPVGAYCTRVFPGSRRGLWVRRKGVGALAIMYLTSWRVRASHEESVVAWKATERRVLVGNLLFSSLGLSSVATFPDVCTFAM